MKCCLLVFETSLEFKGLFFCSLCSFPLNNSLRALLPAVVGNAWEAVTPSRSLVANDPTIQRAR